jgi:uncharacterized protein (TIGR00375 family)
MDIDEITRFAPMKGVNLIGTGDFTHPKWFKELKEKLVEVQRTGLYRPIKESTASLRFMITGEVATIFTFEGNTKKIHNIILTPSLDGAEQISDRLARYGNLEVDGRPTLGMSAALLVEEVMEASSENVVIPAHVWTPWFSLFGDFNGFNIIEDCYQEMTKHIHALETGLSSDPPMNWRLSNLDKFALVSNSDSHSSWPWRIGREANVFELDEFNYHEVIDTIQTKDPKRFKFTIETYPDYGKYHWTGHRNCGVSLPPEEVIKLGDICPVCRRKMTKGVEQRVDELADRPAGFKPEHIPGYIRLLPLSEIIQAVLGASSPSVQRVWSVYSSLISQFGDEYFVLMNASFKSIAKVVDPRMAEAILRTRDGRVKVIPGYDGVYGQMNTLPQEEKEGDMKERVANRGETRKRSGETPRQKSLADYV